MKKYFLTSAKTALVLVYMVIIAGAVVRMTGSGMGCPDWPKCFGYYIPPTEEKELLYTPGKSYEKGQVIIQDEQLFVATTDFVAPSQYKASQWEKYTKHDYAIFNPSHTWVEYINRLVGALAGLACLLTFMLSFSFWKENKKIVFYSFFICFLMGFQAWLGKTVVDSVLSPYKITTHMLVALVIVAFQLYVIASVARTTNAVVKDSKFKLVLYVVLGFTLLQVVLGTQVRESIDHLVESGLPKVFWLESPTLLFYFHRSFSIVIVLANLYLFLRNRRLQLGVQKLDWVMRILLLEIVTGVIMSYLHFPFGSQTAHLVLASILFGVQFYILLQHTKINQSNS